MRRIAAIAVFFIDVPPRCPVFLAKNCSQTIQRQHAVFIEYMAIPSSLDPVAGLPI